MNRTNFVGSLLISAFTALAQPQPVPQPIFKAGDHVEFSANGACLGEQFALPTLGSIVEVNLRTMSYIIQVDAIAGQNARTTSKPIYTQTCGFRAAPPPEAPAPAAPAAATPAVPPAPAAAPAPNPAPPAQGGPAKYSVGDHVQFSLNNACLGEQFAIPTRGTIRQVNLGNKMNYVIEVDPEPNKSQRIVSRPIATQDCGFQLLGSAAPAAPQYNCPTEPPAPPVSKTAGPSEAVFKRVIYDQAVADEATHADVQQVGMSFEIFQAGQPYVNEMTTGGLRKDASVRVLTHDGAPPNATIYPVKVRYSKCIVRPTYKRLWVIEQNRDCFKNRMAEWTCPVGTGDTRFLTQLDLPR